MYWDSSSHSCSAKGPGMLGLVACESLLSSALEGCPVPSAILEVLSPINQKAENPLASPENSQYRSPCLANLVIRPEFHTLTGG